MSVETPAALWGLLSLLLLAIFSLWRQAAVRCVVPSLLIWKRIPERNPPLRALRRPAWRWELLLSALAVASVVTGLAGPYLELDRPLPRRIGIVLDVSARMRDRLDRMVRRAAELQKGVLAGDRVTFYAADPSPRKSNDPGAFRIVDVHVDPAALLAVARAENEKVVLFSDRAPSGTEAELFGGPAANAGIVEFTVSDDEVFARIVNHGPARKVPATLTIDGRAMPRGEIDCPRGERGWFEKGDFSGASSVTLALRLDDGFPVDDVAGASRLAPIETIVSVRGLSAPLVRAALAAVPGVILRAGDGPAVVAVGVDADPGPGSLRVKLHVPPSPRSAAVVRTLHPLMEGIRESEIGSAGVGELPAEAVGGTPLLTSDGRVVAALKGNVLHVAVGLAPDAWPATPSFPIFWMNVIQFARQGRSMFVTARTGRAFAAAGTIEPPGAGAIWTAGLDGSLLAYTAGEYAVDGRRFRANLLDARETETGGGERALAWPGGPGGGRAPSRRALGGWAAGLALVFVVLAWVMQRRTG